MNSSQKGILRSWRGLMWSFLKREWVAAFLATSVGALTAQSVHLIFWDASFQSFLAAKYKVEPPLSFDNPAYYTPYLILGCVAAVAAIAALAWLYIWRGLKSWWAGVTSGLILLPFASTFLLCTLPASTLPSTVSRHRLLSSGAGLILSFCISFLLFLKA